MLPMVFDTIISFRHAVVDSLSPSYTTIELNTTHRTYDVEVFIVGKGRIDILRKYNLLPTSYYTIQSIQNSKISSLFFVD